MTSLPENPREDRNDGGASSRGPRSGPRGSKFRRPRRKVCMFCVEKAESIDYKQMVQPKYSKRLVSERGKIVPRRTTGTCARHQRLVTEAVKRARHIAILPFVVE